MLSVSARIFLHKIGGREVGQQQGGDQSGTDDGLRAIEGEIPRGAEFK
jgi:hypothetical protein